MLARLQQALVFIWLAALAAAVGLPLLQGRPGQAALAAGALLVAHAGWLLLSFLLMRWLNRNDPAPPATWRQWWRAWWSEVRTAPRVFGWQQPFRSHVEADHVPADAHGRTGVVLVHGFVCNRGLWTDWVRRLRAEGVPVVALDLEPVFGPIEGYEPLIEAAVARLEGATGERPILVGHSMGGLAIRAWMAHHASDARVRAVITIGTPHQGTWLANWSRLAPNARQMRPGGEWLSALAQAESPSRRALFTCFYSHADNIVFPASNALLPDARHHHIEATAHMDLVHHPAVWKELWRALGRDDTGSAVAT